MTIKKTKEQLAQLLEQNDSCVIALSGRWGTGKTHLWNDVKANSSDEKVKNALYVSLFGLSSIDQVKRKLIEAAIPIEKTHAKWIMPIKNLIGVGIKAASEHYKALAALNDFNILLISPVILREKVIVIDDIERKHDNLGIDEVLGFIDEYSKQHLSRFILVLNDDQLSTKENQKNLWATFREKVIDQELRLSTSADEAFSIAIELRPSKYRDAIRKASIACSLTNIRIITKIIKVANQILADRELDESIQARVVPSIVLFSAIHYRGMDNGLDFKFALNIGNIVQNGLGKDKEKTKTAEENREHSWQMIMQELGIYGCDDFEKHLVNFLESGLFEALEIEAIIDRYTSESESMKARESAQRFLKKVFWDHRIDEAQLVAEAADFIKIAGLLNPFVATDLYLALESLPGGEEIGSAIIDSWVMAYRESNPTEINHENPFNNPLHQKIEAEFSAIKEKAQAKETIVNACLHIASNRGWGTLQELALRNATVEDFESAIRNIQDLDQLRLFMKEMINMRLQRTTYDHHFGTATQHFVEACRIIASDMTSPRLAGLIRRLFNGSTLTSELTAQPHKTP